MGDIITTFIGCYCASDPIFYPAENPDHNHTVVTVIANRGETKAGVPLKSAVTLNFWGKGARIAACHLEKGRQLSGYGDLLDFVKDTGVVTPAGKKVAVRKNEVRVARFSFGADTQEQLEKRVDKNLAMLQAAGQPVTGKGLIQPHRNATIDYNPALAAATGKYGNARVFIKGQGFLKANGQAVAAPASNAAVGKSVEDLQKEMAAIQAQIAVAGQAAVAGAVDPLAGAK